METEKQKRVIINADDFGFSEGITEGIISAHLDGILTSTTLAANMPAAQGAVNRIGEVPDLGIGVHLNVSQGPPLSAAGQQLADDDGIMRYTAAGVIRACMLKPWLIKVFETEFDAQIRWILDNDIKPTHLDSHRHTHAFSPIFARVARLAKRYDIPFVRQQGERLPGPRTDWPDCPAKQRRLSCILNCFGWVNAKIAPQLRGTIGSWGVAHTGFIDAKWLKKAAETLRAVDGIIEIMTHPGKSYGLDESVTRLIENREAELAALCDPTVKQAFEQNGIELTNYGRLLHSIKTRS